MRKNFPVVVAVPISEAISPREKIISKNIFKVKKNLETSMGEQG